ncbi:general secretion pathway protein GspE [Geotalea sp. SG265]|uniref:GspE/PulE/PilB domain-containing protein n=1 Tax=Geotalea sp. SG265 TaxID=2922867 RepID=UPI001FAEDC5B|nr:general secretion pathway protein GspE [Geotalea sp. SG265]
MAIKLGEILVESGKITQAELDETLKSQVIFGGKIGTNLIEMGYIEEEELAQFLSKKLGVPCAKKEHLFNLSPATAKLIPEETVRKYRVIPLGLDKKKLYVAMEDPSNLASIDEISFITGFIVIPMIATELSIILALEKHYGIKRETRYITVANGGRRQARAARSTGPSQATVSTPPSAKPAPPPEEEVIELPLLSELAEMEIGPAGSSAPAPASFSTAAKETIDKYTIDTLSMELAEAEDRDAIASLIVTFAGQEFDRVALFMVKGNTAGGWSAVSQGKPLAGFEEFQVPLKAPSVLQIVTEGKSFYLGPLADTPGNGTMLAALGGGKPVTALLVPLVMMGRVVSILYVEGGKQPLGERVVDMQKVIGKAAMAFEILILKSKILMT